MMIVYSMRTKGNCITYLLCGSHKNDNKTRCSWTSELFITSGINIGNLSSSGHSNSSTVPKTHSSGTVKANLTERTKMIKLIYSNAT